MSPGCVYYTSRARNANVQPECSIHHSNTPDRIPVSPNTKSGGSACWAKVNSSRISSLHRAPTFLVQAGPCQCTIQSAHSPWYNWCRWHSKWQMSFTASTLCMHWQGSPQTQPQIPHHANLLATCNDILDQGRLSSMTCKGRPEGRAA